jgi:hypothetical protein
MAVFKEVFRYLLLGCCRTQKHPKERTMTSPAEELHALQRNAVPALVSMTAYARLTGRDPETVKQSVVSGEIGTVRVGKRDYLTRTDVLRMLGLADLSGVVAGTA